MKQFEIWWASLPAPAGRRAVLLLSRTGANSYMNKVVVAEITTTIRRLAVEVPLGRDEGLPSLCVANMDNIPTIPIGSLTQKAGTPSAARHRVVKRAIGYGFGWDERLGL